MTPWIVSRREASGNVEEDPDIQRHSGVNVLSSVQSSRARLCELNSLIE